MVSFQIDGKEFMVANPAYWTDLSWHEKISFTVESQPRSYEIQYDASPDVKNSIRAFLATEKKNLTIIDENVYRLYPGLSLPEETTFVAKATENFKSLKGAKRIWDFFQKHSLTKGDRLLVIGGGTIHDTAGFAAGCYKRGISWYLWPTTLLSMSNSCIGGKTGINYGDAKNQLGLFYPPNKVILQPHFLETLPLQEIRSGLGEILGLSLLAGRDFLERYKSLVPSPDQIRRWASLEELILLSLNIKKAIIEEDEFEHNHRRALNYGHTFGHAIEVLSRYKIPHGQAVAMGILLANELSYRKGFLSQSVKDEITPIVRNILSPKMLARVQKMPMTNILDVIQKDKKAGTGTISFVLLSDLGKVIFHKTALDNDLRLELESILQSVFR